MERRLAAILAADVVGYSRLMGADEEATLAKLSAYRAVIDALVSNHRGRVFGSGVLAMAVPCRHKVVVDIDAARSRKEMYNVV